MTGNEHISQEDKVLYTVQALSQGESVTVSQHLANCALCREELAELYGDVAMVGFSVPQHTLPSSARQKFLNRIAIDATAQREAAITGGSKKESGTQSVKQPPRGQVLSFPKNSWVPWAIAAALAFIAIALSVQNNALNKELRDNSNKIADLTNQSAQARQVLDVMTSRSAQHVLLTASKTSVEPTGRAIYLAASGSLVFQGNNLKLLASDKTYELWVIPVSGKPVPAGLFRPDASGNASLVMPPLPTGIAAKAFGVTIENSAGSDTPTAPIVLSGAATAGEGE